MLIPQFTILYVANPAHSTLFYRELFGRPPVEESPTFAMFVFESGARLALWSSATVEPAVTQSTDGCAPLCPGRGSGLYP